MEVLHGWALIVTSNFAVDESNHSALAGGRRMLERRRALCGGVGPLRRWSPAQQLQWVPRAQLPHSFASGVAVFRECQRHSMVAPFPTS